MSARIQLDHAEYNFSDEEDNCVSLSSLYRYIGKSCINSMPMWTTVRIKTFELTALCIAAHKEGEREEKVER